ncbi:hypothetical protein [Spirosoma sp. 209]|uniref:hypothetical protein n=1 Tax=Spirosoma sp. 209 TaxID=1955701 RepID=UPI001116E1D1|nr:hypothetical protein [Spirosoma sp. 209]
MRFYSFVTSLLLLATWGCQQESVTVSPDAASLDARSPTAATKPAAAQNFRLKQLFVEGYAGGLGPYFVTTHFEYNEGRALKRAIIPPTSAAAPELTNEYTYDQQGRVVSYFVRYSRPNGDGSVGELNTFTFGDNRIEQSFARQLADGQKLPTAETNPRHIYRTNADGQMTEWIQEGIIRYGKPTRARYVYTYENGNITRATYLDANDKAEFTISYEYDDKPNPFYRWMYTIDPVLYNSRNNVVSTQVNESAPSRTEYTYTDSGLPATKKDVTKGAVLTYEYETY